MVVINKQTVLNSREVKKITKYLKEQYGIEELKLKYGFLKNTKDKIHIISTDPTELDLKNMRVNLVGIYFCKEEPERFRLSIEGSQIIGPMATKNILEIDENTRELWLAGEDIHTEEKLSGYVIIKHNGDYYGCGQFSEGKIWNYVPKSRRVKIKA